MAVFDTQQTQTVRPLFEDAAQLAAALDVQEALNHKAGILDSLPHTMLATVLPGRARQMHANQGLLWKPLSDPRVPLKVGLVFRDAQRQQATLELLRSMLEGVVGPKDLLL
ncbi:hypothetical protein M2318_003479 [Metapseudomonas resinovorans]